jgi:peroxiredoxin
MNRRSAIAFATVVLSSALAVACGGPPAPSAGGIGEAAAHAPDESPTEAAKSSGPDGNGTHVGDAKPVEGNATVTPAAGAAAPAGPTLGETPDAKLGTAPSGFGIAVGQKAPDATLDDLTGKKQKLSDLYKAGPTFVVFYRGGWCPFCNLQLHDLAAAKADFEKRGIKLVAISVDKPSEEAKTQAKDGVPFPMLSDSKLVAHKAFKVVHATGEEEQKKMASFGVDLGAYSGEAHKSFAIPSVFLVDKGGVVRFAHVDEDYKTRPSPKQLLGVADKLGLK